MENGNEVRTFEVRYAGVVVGRSTKVRDWDNGGAFIGFPEPLPSGTSLVLRADGVDRAARVLEVYESADPTVAGMQVVFIGASEAARPAPKPAAPAPTPVTATLDVPAPAAPATAEPAPVSAELAPAAEPVPTAELEPAPAAVVAASPVEASEVPAPAGHGHGEAGQVEHAEQSGQPGKRRRRRR